MSQFDSLLHDYRQRVDNVLLRFIQPLASGSETLAASMRYGALLGGKRLRPSLVYITGKIFGATLEALDAPAAAIECIHAYSLIHDDLPAIDNDQLRRGQPTCHIKFGQANAILAGDALQTLAFSILCDAPMPKVSTTVRLAMLSELANASGALGMCAGQALDLAAEDSSITLEELERIHRHKTGALIRAAVRLGAMAAGEKELTVRTALDNYADAIGLAFQVQDDILDVTGETVKIGKQSGNDQRLGKSTYPALLGLKQARTKTQDLYQEALTALSVLSAQDYDVAPLEALASFIVARDN